MHIRVSVLVTAVCLAAFSGASGASPCERTDRVYEVRTCMRIQERYQRLRGPSLAQPAQQTGATLGRRRGRPVVGFIEAGVLLRRDSNRVWVTQVQHGSPADAAGIQPEDDILELDGKSVGSNLSAEQVAGMLGGKAGTQVAVTIGRRNVGEIQAIVVREKAAQSDATAQMRGRIAVLTIRSFSHSAVETVETMLKAQSKVQNPRGVVLDLRAHPGGNISPLLQLLGFLLPQDATVATLQTTSSATAVRTEGKPLLPLDTPVAILVSHNPPPAVALVVGALKTAGTKPVTVVLSDTPANATDRSLLTIRADGALRLYRPPADAFLLPNSQTRILFDAAYANAIADIANPPPDSTNDPALSYALDVLE